MQPTYTQPGANRISDHLIQAVVAVAGDGAGTPPLAVDFHHQYSNDVAVVTLSCGRRLMLKRGRHSWSKERFEVAREASSLLRQEAGIIAPEPLDLPPLRDAAVIEAYWRIELPLFADVWGTLDARQRRESMRSLGALVRRAHRAEPGTGESQARSLGSFSVEGLREDLTARLGPAVAGEWPEALDMVERLIEAVPDLFDPAAIKPVVLHGDLHLGNVLCRRDGEEVSCVGLLDLEWAHFGPPESDLARLHVMHQGPFEMPVAQGDLGETFAGYGEPLDERLLSFFTLLHYLNLGLYSAVIGDDWHASEVAAAARRVALPS